MTGVHLTFASCVDTVSPNLPNTSDTVAEAIIYNDKDQDTNGLRSREYQTPRSSIIDYKSVTGSRSHRERKSARMPPL